MKRLKYRLERKIADLMSAAILWCEGKGCFRISSAYRFPISEHFILDITKQMGYGFSFHAILRRDGQTIMDTLIDYDIYLKDVPIQKAYTLKETMMDDEIDNIPDLKNILKEMRRK